MELKEETQLFEVPTEDAEPAEDVKSQVEKNLAMPDLSGLGLLDYEESLKEDVEASSSNSGDQEAISGNQEQGTETPKAAKDDPQQMQYWQSKNDRTEAENQRLRDLAPKAQQWAPLIEAIQKDPEVLDFIQNKISNGGLGNPSQKQQAQPKNGQQAMMQGPPEKPEKISNYDAAAAIHEQESASYKYREALDKYRDDMDTWHQQQDIVRYQQMQMSQQNQMASQKVLDNYHVLKFEYGAQDTEIADYNKRLQDPNFMSIHNLWKYHQFLNSPEAERNIVRQKAEADIEQKSRVAKMPKTPAKSAGKENATLTDADLFNLGLLQNRK